MKVALIGNQNSGKTSLFNKLTGENQKVGNWPGVTIAKKTGKIKGTDFELIDLPGVYSLMPYTEEENISRNYLLQEKPDVIINVIDSTSLERNLYLTTQLMDLDMPIVLALNMTDLLDKKNIILDEMILSKKLGLDAVKVSARTGFGIDTLVEKLRKQKTQNNIKNIEKYPKIIENELNLLKIDKKSANNFTLLEQIMNDDENFLSSEKEVARVRNVVCKIFGEDIEGVIANLRYEFISHVCENCLDVKNRKKSISEKLDKIFLNRFLAIPIFILIMTLVYYLSVGVVGRFTTSFIEHLVDKFSLFAGGVIKKLGVSDWITSLICNGIIAGVGSVLTFLPELIVIFLAISLLETTGYMSRISFIFDRLFQKIGLSGRALVPFIVGTGCSVPAISMSRTIESESEKQMTIVLTPFVPCSAKLPIIALFVGYFFPNCSGLVTALLYFFAIGVIIISALIMKKFIFKNKATSFISELPEYRAPSIKYISKDCVDKTKDFVIRAGTIILFCSVIVWFLSSFGWNLRFSSSVNDSILAWIGDKISWFFYPIIGERNWAISVSAIQGLIAKEQVVSSMNVIAGIENLSQMSIFESEIFSGFSKASAISFIIFNLFSAPCVASIGAMKNELKSTKKLVMALLFQIVLAWSMSSLIFLILKNIL